MAIFPKLCLWRRSLCSNLGGIDPEKLYRATLSPPWKFYKAWVFQTLRFKVSTGNPTTKVSHRETTRCFYKYVDSSHNNEKKKYRAVPTYWIVKACYFLSDSQIP